MSKIGIFFGTDTGNTRKIAKQIKKRFDDELMAKPLNVNRHRGRGLHELRLPDPGHSDPRGRHVAGAQRGCGKRKLGRVPAQARDQDFTGKTIAIYGLGDQVTYPAEFVDAIYHLHEFFEERGATLVGSWPIDGYEFEASMAVVDDQFLGLALDLDNQSALTEERVTTWLDQIAETFGLPTSAAVAAQ